MATQFVESVEGLEFSDFDPFSAEFRENPEKYHPLLLAQSPGFITMEGVPSAYIAGFAQCQAVLRNFKGFSSLKPKGLPGMERIDFFNGLPVMNYSDPPDHTRRRKVVNPAFTPKRTQMLNENAAIIIDSMIDKIMANGGGFEALGDFTKIVSIDTLLRHFMGIEDKDQPIFMNYVMTLPLLDKMRPGDPKPQAYLDAWAAGAAYCKEQQELARRGECRNLIGVIAEGAEGGAIDDDEMMAMMIVLLIGGVSTVAGAAAASLMNLARNPDVAERVRQDPSLAINVLEESMRLDPPVSLVMRFATDNIEVGGKVIPKGMPTYVMLGVACHDPSVYPDPYKFDIDRPNVKDHIAFGHGMHTCIGNAITRNVVPLLIQKVVGKMPNLRLADRPDALEWDTSTPRARHIGKLYLQA
ncbi:cytochrome P450 [Sphingobium fontiphilum]|uniref:Cytochrome P450 n=1 Tax=Sphingobium fontiphilum TaxID=944425 RepID=A0A7W6GPD6_9SPHN|nr:cytochrome P450 [Sphingobium fontiphilum]MBB3982293.1 cytochrome P450 [Sphingobium fontiphilum]